MSEVIQQICKPDLVFVAIDPVSLGQPYVLNLFAKLCETFSVKLVLPKNIEGRAGIIEKSPVRVFPNGLTSFRGNLIGGKLKSRIWHLSKIVKLTSPINSVPCRAIGEAAASIQSLGIRNVVAIEYAALLACGLAGVSAHFVSLELLQQRIESLLVDSKIIRSCMTQNWLRYLALFPCQKKIPCFIVPNFPPCRPVDARRTVRREGCILAGSALPGFGLDIIADYIKEYNKPVTFLGWSPPDLSGQLRRKGVTDSQMGRITIESDFLSDEKFIERIAGHEFAFGLYDLSRANDCFFGEGIGLLPWSAQNYIIGFPGKIGMCMNAGVPVITSNYPGTSFVNKFGVGVVIDEMSPAAINAASIKIRNAGDAMRSRCLDLAKEFCFNVHVAPFVDFIRAETAVAKGS